MTTAQHAALRRLGLAIHRADSARSLLTRYDATRPHGHPDELAASLEWEAAAAERECAMAEVCEVARAVVSDEECTT